MQVPRKEMKIGALNSERYLCSDTPAAPRSAGSQMGRCLCPLRLRSCALVTELGLEVQTMWQNALVNVGILFNPRT